MDSREKVASLLEELADLLEIQGEIPYKIRAYRNAARSISLLETPLEEIEDFTTIAYVGKEIAKKIEEILETGTLKKLEELRKKIPRGVREMLKLPGLGPKKVRLLYEKLQISSIEELKEKAQKNLLSSLPGFGEKTQEKILKAIEKYWGKERRILRIEKKKKIKPLVEFLSSLEEVEKIEIAGSIRRKKATVKDADILVQLKDPQKASQVIEKIASFDAVEIESKGEKKVHLYIEDFPVDIRFIERKSWGSALCYFTGSKEHNIILREKALQKGYKLNEYGLFQEEKYICGEKEEEIYQKLGLSFIPPEIREGTEEITLAEEKKIPPLVEREDIIGDLHLHTKWSDGRSSIEEMVKKALKKNYRYIAITDHSPSLKVAGGLSLEEIEKQWEEMERIRSLYPIEILKGMEIDILEDGSLDLPNSYMKELDIALISIHSHFHLEEEKQLTRLLKAIENPYVTAIAHPTGRLLLKREGIQIPWEKFLEKVKERGIFLELNGNPWRMDLSWEKLRIVKEMGIPILINTDAHSPQEMDYMEYAIYEARKAFLQKKDILNTLSPIELIEKLKETKKG